MRSFYRLSEKLARTIAELSLFCQEHLANDETGYLWGTSVLMKALENSWQYWVGYEYDRIVSKQSARTFVKSAWKLNPEIYLSLEAEDKKNDKSWKRNRPEAYVKSIMWDFVGVLYAVSQNSLCVCPTNDKSASFLAWMLQQSHILTRVYKRVAAIFIISYNLVYFGKCICINAQGLRMYSSSMVVRSDFVCTDIASYIWVLYMSDVVTFISVIYVRCCEFH